MLPATVDDHAAPLGSRRPHLEEALTHGPDPLHLAAVFGLAQKTAIRYAASARQLLDTDAEQQDGPDGNTSQRPETRLQYPA